MEITTRGPQQLILEDKSPILRIVLSALVMAGLILPLATMKEFGPQSYYRLTYWMGGLLIILGAVSILFLYRSSQLHLDQEADRIWLLSKKGIRTVFRKEFRLSLIDDIRIEQHPRQEQYRITIHHIETGWHPISHRYQGDLSHIQQAANGLRSYLTAS